MNKETQTDLENISHSGELDGTESQNFQESPSLLSEPEPSTQLDTQQHEDQGASQDGNAEETNQTKENEPESLDIIESSQRLE